MSSDSVAALRNISKGRTHRGTKNGAYYLYTHTANAVRNMGFRGVWIPSTSGPDIAFTTWIGDVNNSGVNWLIHAAQQRGMQSLQTSFTGYSSTPNGTGSLMNVGGQYPNTYETDNNGQYPLPSPIGIYTPVTWNFELVDPGAATPLSNVSVNGTTATFTVGSTTGITSGATVYVVGSQAEFGSGSVSLIAASSANGGASTTFTLSSPVSTRNNHRLYIIGGAYGGQFIITAPVTNSTTITAPLPWLGNTNPGGTINPPHENDGAYTVASVTDSTHFTVSALPTTHSAPEACYVATKRAMVKLLYAGTSNDIESAGMAATIANSGSVNNFTWVWYEAISPILFPTAANDAGLLSFWLNASTESILGQTVLQWSQGLDALGANSSYGANGADPTAFNSTLRIVGKTPAFFNVYVPAAGQPVTPVAGFYPSTFAAATVTSDPDSGWSADHYTVPTGDGGTWEFNGHLELYGGAQGHQSTIYLFKNGSPIAYATATQNTYTTPCAINYITTCNAGDVFRLGVASADATTPHLANQGVTYTAVPGASASITIQLIAGGGGAEVVSVSGNAITIAARNGGSSASQVVAAVNGDPGASALVTASGSGQTVLSPFAPSPLTTNVIIVGFNYQLGAAQSWFNGKKLGN